jgi:hypothetical protein
VAILTELSLSTMPRSYKKNYAKDALRSPRRATKNYKKRKTTLNYTTKTIIGIKTA